MSILYRGPATFLACKQHERANAWRTSKIASGRRVGRSRRGRLSAAQGKGLRTHPPGHIDVSIEAGREDLRAVIGGSLWHGRVPDSCGPPAAVQEGLIDKTAERGTFVAPLTL